MINEVQAGVWSVVLQSEVFIKLTEMRADPMAWTRILFEQKLKVELVKEAGGQD